MDFLDPLGPRLILSIDKTSGMRTRTHIFHSPVLVCSLKSPYTLVLSFTLGICAASRPYIGFSCPYNTNTYAPLFSPPTAFPACYIPKHRCRVDRAKVPTLCCLLYLVIYYLSTHDIRPWFPVAAGLSCAGGVNEPHHQNGNLWSAFRKSTNTQEACVSAYES